MVVTESGGVSVATGDVAVSVQATYTEKKVENDSYDYAGRTGTNGDKYQQLCEKLYGRDLVKSTGSTSDDMGRPTTNWTYLGTKVESVETPDATYTGATALSDIYADLNLTTDKKVWVYLNGDDTQAVQLTLSEKNKNCKVSSSQIGAKQDDDDTWKVGGKGYTLEFFVDDDKKVTGVAYTEFLAKATADYNASDESVGIEVYTNLKGFPTKLESDDFDGLESIKEDDYLLVTAAKTGTDTYTIQTFSTPQIVSGVTVTGWKEDKTIVAGGTTYSYAAYAVGDKEKNREMMVNKSGMLNEDYDLFLDSNGYVIGVDDADDSVSLDNYLFVTKKNSDTFGGYQVKAVFMDGTDATITLKKLNSDSLTDKTFTDNISVNTFYTFTVRSDGKYDLKSIKS
jgi:hypothetical protein